MRFVLVALVLGLSLAGTAQAAEKFIDLSVCMDPCCTFTCMTIDLECCGYCCEVNPMTVEFMGRDGNVLGTAVIEDYCGGCADESYAQFDNAIDSGEVCFIRLTSDFDDCCIADWAAIKVFCDDPCDCGKWKTAWKGDLRCWTTVK